MVSKLMKKALSTSHVARILGVAVGSVANWIDQGQLKAGRTPGGHRRVTTEDLVEFLRRQKLPVPPELAPLSPKVLVVDDEPSVTKLLAAEITEKHPEFEVLEAHDGFAAGELVGSAKPDVVILDLRMAGLDGFEVCRRIKAKKETRDIAVIAMTAYHSSEAEERILQCGARKYLVKPLDMGVLLEEIEIVMEQHQ